MHLKLLQPQTCWVPKVKPAYGYGCSCSIRTRRTPGTGSAPRARSNDSDDNGSIPASINRSAARQMEDELRDPGNFLEYLVPRPLRLVFFWGGAASCTVALILELVRLSQVSGALLAQQDPVSLEVLQNVGINAGGLLLFGALALADQRAAAQRLKTRKRVREAQIRIGDRETFINEQGEKMSRLKEVDEAWVVRRLEVWGKRENVPFIGPKKGSLITELVAERAPSVAVEVGAMAGYSAIMIARGLPPGGKLVSFEKDFSWWLTTKRFLWQASQGQPPASGVRVQDKVDVRWSDAVKGLENWSAEPEQAIHFLFLDGVPRESLSYLQAAEPHLAPGAVVVADNAGVFAEGGMKEYLTYVRSSPKYQSRFIETTLEWRDDVPDGLEVSVYQGAQK